MKKPSNRSWKTHICSTSLDYLNIAKQKRPGIKKIRKAVGKQLGYVSRDLDHVHEMIAEQGIEGLTNKQIAELPVIEQLYEQQLTVHKMKIHRIVDRIVSISQSHVRPIVRGKAKASTEFGAKVSISPAWQRFMAAVAFPVLVETALDLHEQLLANDGFMTLLHIILR